MFHYREWQLHVLIGMLISIVYFTLSLSMASRILPIILTLIVSGACLHVHHHYSHLFTDKQRLLHSAVVIALSFECFIMIEMIVMLHYTLPSFTELIFAYVTILITTFAIIPSLLTWGLFIRNGMLEKLFDTVKTMRKNHDS